MNHTGLRMRVLMVASLIVAVGATALSQSASANSDSVQVIQFLNQTIDWYRNMSSVQQAAAEPDDLLVASDNARMADQIVRLAFEFARGEAELIRQQRKSGQNQSQSAGYSDDPAL